MTTYTELATLQQAADEAAANELAARERLTALVARGTPTRLLVSAEAAVESTARAATTARSALDAALTASTEQSDPLIPVLLLPVRLETRYGTSATGGTILRVRVYPDDIHFDSHRTVLTEREGQAGTDYWAAMAVGATTADALAAWGTLARDVGPARAEWVAAACDPSGPGPTIQGTDAWTRAEQAALLPDAWFVTAWRGDHPIATATGRVIARPLNVGPDPTVATADDPGILWMTDFEEAIRVGMGVVVDLPDDGPLDLVTVAGIRGTEPPSIAAGELGDLLTAHRYSVGFDLVPPGAPTNTTDAGASAVGSVDAGGTDLFVDPAQAPTPEGSSLADLREALGLAVDNVPPVGRADLSSADVERDMATALWPGTWGYYLSQMLHLHDYESLHPQWRRWVLDNVRGGGPLPAIRVGSQPYGVLPILPLAEWRPSGRSTALVVAELGAPQRRRGLSGARPTVLRALDEVDGEGSWTTTAPLGSGPTAPNEATGVTIASGVTPEGTVAAFAFPGVVVKPTEGLACPIGTLTRDGWQASGELTIPLDHSTIANLQIVGVALTFTTLPDSLASGRPGTGDVVAVVQCQPDRSTDRPVWMLVGQGVHADGTVEQWSPPLDISKQVKTDERVQSATVTITRDVASLLVVTSPAEVTAPGSRQILHAAQDVRADGTVAGSWARPAPIGPDLDPGVTPVGSALVRLPDDGAARVAAALFFEAGNGVTGTYSVLEVSRRGASLTSLFGPYNLGSASGSAVAASCAAVTWDRARDERRGLGDRTESANLLQHLKDVWLSGATSPVRSGVGDPTRQLLDILASDATSQRYEVRAFLGDAVLSIVDRAFDPADIPGAPLDSASVVDLLTADLGLVPRGAGSASPSGATPWSRLLRGRFVSAAHDSGLPFARSEPTDTKAGWIEGLLAATPADLHDHVDDERTTLLERLMRYSLLQAYAEAAFLVKPPAAADTSPPWREPEIVDLTDYSSGDPQAVRTVTSWRYLSGEDLNGQPLADVIHKEARRSNPDAWALPVADVLTALARLRDLPIEEIERAAANVLDVATHRLDAWITGFTTDLLRQRRASRPDGLVVGAYGVVTNLSPAPVANPTTGYIYAPSLTHATTAAVLRSGYLSHGSGPLAIDLSSRRARGALEVMDAVSQGQSLGEVLGQRLERGLHEARLDAHLSGLRAASPLDIGLLTPLPTGATAAHVAGKVRIDGLRILGMRSPTDGSLPWGTQGLPTPPSADAAVIEALVARLADDVDAIADIGVAEGVHQALQRNTQRAAAALDAVSRGDAPLPVDPDVLHVPQAGVGVTNRIILHTPAPSGRYRGWGAGPRAEAEPRLNAWAARALPDPQTTYWRAVYTDPDGNEVGADEYRLSDLGLSPLDVIAMASPAAGDLARTDLGALALLYAAGEPRPADTRVRVDLEPDPTRAPDLSLAEFLTVAGCLRGVVLSGRPARSGDLAPAGHSAESGIDLDVTVEDLRARLVTALAELSTKVVDLRKPFATTADLRRHLATVLPEAPDLANLLDLPMTCDLDVVLDIDEDGDIVDEERPRPSQFTVIRGLLVDVARLGVGGVIPDPGTDAPRADRLALTALARRTAQTAQARHATAAQSLIDADAAASPDAAITALLAGLSAVFGEGFVALPLLRTGLPAAAPPGFTENDAWDWAEQAADVREATGRLRDAALLGEAAGGARTRWTVRQHSGDPLDGWAAGSALPGREVPSWATSIALVGVDSTWPGGELAGLVIDSWVEVVPTGTADTAVTFHLDTPDACAPQTALLGVHPDPGRPWGSAMLAAVVREAAHLAMVRSVAPHEVPLLGHLLPALLTATNPAGDAISVAMED